MSKNSEEILAETNYNITLDEEDKAFRIFQRLYVFKKNLFRSALFAIVAAVFAVQIIMGKGDSIAWGLITVCVAFIAVIWITPIRIRKMLLIALETLKDDRYIFRLYNDSFEIETIIPQADTEEKEEQSDEDDDERIQPPPSRYSFSKDGLRLVETSEMYLIFVSKETFHILPKRALSESDRETVEEIFHKKFGDYKNI